MNKLTLMGKAPPPPQHFLVLYDASGEKLKARPVSENLQQSVDADEGLAFFSLH